jgi:hypothetical protein
MDQPRNRPLTAQEANEMVARAAALALAYRAEDREAIIALEPGPGEVQLMVHSFGVLAYQLARVVALALGETPEEVLTYFGRTVLGVDGR